MCVCRPVLKCRIRFFVGYGSPPYPTKKRICRIRPAERFERISRYAPRPTLHAPQPTPPSYCWRELKHDDLMPLLLACSASHQVRADRLQGRAHIDVRARGLAAARLAGGRPHLPRGHRGHRAPAAGRPRQPRHDPLPLPASPRAPRAAACLFVRAGRPHARQRRGFVGPEGACGLCRGLCPLADKNKTAPSQGTTCSLGTSAELS